MWKQLFELAKRSRKILKQVELFRAIISKKVITMAAMKKHMRAGTSSVYNTNLIYSCVTGLQWSRNISMNDILQYELSPVDTSLFRDAGAMCIPWHKSLNKTLQVKHSGRTAASADAIIIGGCAVMWVIHWSTTGTVANYANIFMQYVCSLMNTRDVYLTFDRYENGTTKGWQDFLERGKGSIGNTIC